MTCILIALLVIQALDYVFSFGVNNYLFVIFCIVFAFTLGSVYYNIVISNNREELDCRIDELEARLDELSVDDVDTDLGGLSSLFKEEL